MKELIKILDGIKSGVDWENESALIGNHILDSLKIVQLVGSLNDEFDIEITPIDIVPENFKTVNAIYEMIKRIEDE